MKNVFTLAILLCLLSCKPAVEQTDASARIDLKNITTPSFYDYFSQMEVIPLETNDSSLINNMTKIIHRNNHFYILDRETKRIVVFDDNGKFLEEINKLGIGPGEYSEIADFGFNDFTGELELLVPMGGILRYDSTGKEFKGKFLFPDGIPAVHYFMPMEKDVYLLFSESRDGKKMLVYNVQRNEILTEMYDIPRFILFNTIYHHSYSPFYVLNNQIHFVQGYNGDVYTIGKESMDLKYHWDFGKQNFSIEGLPERNMEYYLKYMRTTGAKYANAFTAYGENSHYFITYFLYNQKTYTLIYDKQQKEAKIFNQFQEGNRVSLFFLDEKAFYGYIDPGWSITPNIIEQMDEKFKEKFADMKTDDNPYIIKYIFKQQRP